MKVNSNQCPYVKFMLSILQVINIYSSKQFCNQEIPKQVFPILKTFPKKKTLTAFKPRTGICKISSENLGYGILTSFYNNHGLEDRKHLHI